MSGVRIAAAVLGILVGGGCSLAQNASLANAMTSQEHPEAQVRFHYENPQLQPAKYTFLINQDGSGRFHSEPSDSPPPDTAGYNPLPQPQDRQVHLSQPIVDRIFATAHEQKLFAVECEEAKSKVAFQGKKQLSYRGPDGSGSCTFNWSKLVSIQKLTSVFESIAFTLEEGRRLAVEQKHDRLSVDAEMEQLVSAARDGRALEIENIRPELQAIIEDEAVLERARSRARMLLDEAKSTASLR